jgi:hypothetical protein
MAKCGACGTTILFGGVKDGDLRFCNARCHARGGLVLLMRELPPDEVKRRTYEVHHGQCPVCQGAGPVDVHTSHQVWSAAIMTSWKNTPRISCRSCGVKSQMGNALFSLFLGWWGFPWGLIMTPVQITRNIVAAVRSRGIDGPSPDLERMVGMTMAAELARRRALTGA